MEIICEQCRKKSKRSPKEVRKSKHHFCSLQCSAIWQRVKRITLQCKYCDTVFIKTEKGAKRNGQFCSRSCANKARPRRRKTKKCRKCSSFILSTRAYCPTCIKAKKHIEHSMVLNRPIGSYIKTGGANRFNAIRQHARRITKSRPQICVNCGYDKHIHAAHKKDIKDFPLITLLSEVNHPDNLVLLCPNCHWEFDHPI